MWVYACDVYLFDLKRCKFIALVILFREESKRQIASSSPDSEDSVADVGCCVANHLSLKEWLRAIDVITYVLVVIFAISSWIDINGLWVELPILVNRLPEQWALASYIIVIVQIANIGPLFYTIGHRLCPSYIHEVPVSYIIISIGAISVLFLVHFWDHTTAIDGKQRSLSLFILCGFLSLVDCTSSVVFLPFMQRFPSQYMTALFIGEGLSGFLPGLIGLFQGVGSDPECVNTTVVIYNATTDLNMTSYVVYPEYESPNFGVETFFYCLFSILILSLLAFFLLNNLVCVKSNHTAEFQQGSASTADHSIVESHPNYYAVRQQESSSEPSPEKDLQTGSDSSAVLVAPDTNMKRPTETRRNSFRLQVYLLVLTAWVCALTNGVLPAMQPYTCLPYGTLYYCPITQLHHVKHLRKYSVFLQATERTLCPCGFQLW